LLICVMLLTDVLTEVLVVDYNLEYKKASSMTHPNRVMKVFSFCCLA